LLVWLRGAARALDGARRGFPITRARVRQCHTNFASSFSLSLSFDVFKPRADLDHAAAAYIADEHAPEFALPNQLRLGATTWAEQILERLSQWDE